MKMALVAEGEQLSDGKLAVVSGDALKGEAQGQQGESVNKEGGEAKAPEEKGAVGNNLPDVDDVGNVDPETEEEELSKQPEEAVNSDVSNVENAEKTIPTTVPVPVVTTAAVVPTMTEAVVPVIPETTKPALRSEKDPTEVENATASEAVKQYLDQGNPLILAGFAAICCFFLLLWARKRRLSSLSSSDGGGSSGSAAVETGATAAGAPVTKKINSKVQYSRIDDHFEAESPFSKTHGEDSDDYDDEDEDGFGQDRDKWDDWEPEEAKASQYDSDPNPFAAPVGVKFSAPKPAAPVEAPAFKLNPPPSVTSTASTPVREIELGATATSPPGNSVGSNSSSDSFEVVVDEPTASGYPLFPAPASSLPKEEKKEEKKESVDDLFSVRCRVDW